MTSTVTTTIGTTTQGRASALDLTGTPAELYERHLVPRLFLPWARGLVERLDPQPGERALDVACGTGAVTRLLAERVGPGGRVAGLDVNAGMLAVARAAVTSPNVAWREASAMDLPFAGGAFDVVSCQQGLQFCPDRPRALREMRRVLAPDGRLGVACWRDIAASPGYAALERALTRRLGPEQGRLPPFGLGDAAELRRLVEAGFRCVELQALERTVVWPSADAFVRVTAASGPTLVAALAAQGDTALAEIVAEVEEVMQPFRGPGGELRFPIGNHLVLARR